MIYLNILSKLTLYKKMYPVLVFVVGDRYSSEPKNFDDAFDEFDDKTTRKSSFRKFRERSYSGKEFHDEDDTSKVR